MNYGVRLEILGVAVGSDHLITSISVTRQWTIIGLADVVKSSHLTRIAVCVVRGVTTR